MVRDGKEEECRFLEPLKTLTFWDYMRRYGTIRNLRCISHNPEVGGSSPPSATTKTAVFYMKTAVFITF